MEGVESRSPTQHDDSQIRPEFSTILEDNIQEFAETVEDILQQMAEDESFSQMTAETYDKKKSYLTKHITELSRLHMMLVNQHVRLIKNVSKNCPSLIKYKQTDSYNSSSPQAIQKSSPLEVKPPMDYDFVFVANGSGSNASKEEGFDSDSSFSLSSDSDSEPTYKVLSSPVKDSAYKDSALEVKVTKVPKVSKVPEFLLENNYYAVNDPVCNKKLQPQESDIVSEKSEKSHLDLQKRVNDLKLMISFYKQKEKSHLDLQKQVDDLKLVISEYDLKVKTMEDELEKYQKSLSIAKDTISNLKGENSSKVFQQNQIMRNELQSGQKLVSEARLQLKAQLEKYRRLEEQLESCADEVKKLNTKNYQYKSEVSKLEETLKSKEEIWYKDVAKLKLELKNKSKSFDDLKKRLNTVRLEKNKVSGKVEALEEEKCSLEARLDALKCEHGRVVLEVVELEGEVYRQKEAISVITEEKMEAIRQLTSSLEHYKTRYEQVRQAFADYKAGCFGFLSFFKP